jgi:hypothetical protein
MARGTGGIRATQCWMRRWVGFAGAARQKWSEQRQDPRAGSYERILGTRAGDFTLKGPKLRWKADDPDLHVNITLNSYGAGPIEGLIKGWLPLTFVVDGLNRSSVRFL